MNVTETPHKWIILKLPENEYKVYGTWKGGYLDGDSYKLNSGIAKVESDEDYYYFFGYSGSCYKCYKKGYGVASSYGSGVLEKILDMGKGKVEVLKDRVDWEKLKL